MQPLVERFVVASTPPGRYFSPASGPGGERLRAPGSRARSICHDNQIVDNNRTTFEGLYEYRRRALIQDMIVRSVSDFR
jgi:hypothetical protein